jgi:peptide deformylase
MSLPVNRLEIVTDTSKLKIKGKKISKWAGERLGMKLIKFIAWKNIECVGLAASQLGINERVFVLFDGKEYAIFINPRIVEIGPMEDTQVEGCLSIPGRRFAVKRPTSVVVKDAVRTRPFELSGWTARAWLHELDHLNGRLISDIGEEVTEESVQKPL